MLYLTAGFIAMAIEAARQIPTSKLLWAFAHRILYAEGSDMAFGYALENLDYRDPYRDILR